MVAAKHGNANAIENLLTNKANIEAHAKVLSGSGKVKMYTYVINFYSEIMFTAPVCSSALKMGWKRHC